MRSTYIVVLALLLFAAVPAARENPDTVSADTWTDGDWPLTIDGGILTCVKVPVVGRPEAVIIYDHDGKAWPVNGVARMHHKRYAVEPKLDPIWREDPEIPGAKVSVGPLIKRGLKECE